MSKLLALSVAAALPLTILANTALARSGSEGACTATASTLGGARRAYAERCELARVDCDPLGAGWMCSSERIGRRAPARAAALPAPAAPPDEPVTEAAVVTPGRTGGACQASATGLAEARRRYAQRCSAPRVDCDLDGGDWTCASYRIGLAAPGQRLPAAALPAPAPSNPTPEAPTSQPDAAPAADGSLRVEAETGVGEGWINTGTSLLWRGGNRYRARQASGDIAYTVRVPSTGDYRFTMRARSAVIANPAEPPNDVWVKFGTIPWTKAYFSKRTMLDGRFHVGADGERAGDKPNRVELITSRLTVGTHTVHLSGRSDGHEIDWIELLPVGGGATSGSTTDVGTSVGTGGGATPHATYTRGDLLSLHWDSYPDIDDLQAMIAAREILDDNPVADLISVAGTVRRSFDQVLDGTDEINQALYGGEAVNALDPGTFALVVGRWKATLQRGATVHVAEGGPSDFTARVLRELAAQGVPGLERVRVVQHSSGGAANERNTGAQNLADVKRLATYVPIADGNRDNDTPGLFEGNATAKAAFRRRALQSTYGQQWSRAFGVAAARGRNAVDFSDAVETMHILGLPKSVAPHVTAFADRYFR